MARETGLEPAASAVTGRKIICYFNGCDKIGPPKEAARRQKCHTSKPLRELEGTLRMMRIAAGLVVD